MSGPRLPTLESVAAELYAGAPSDFVKTRNARAKDTTDGDLSALIKGLRKPSVAAWIVNVFATERTDHLAEALQLAADLREAQDELDARALAQLGRDRRALTTKLASEAVDLASSRGERVTESTREAVRQTIAAAFFDPRAAAAVASGRLVRELAPGDDIEDDLDDLVAGGVPSSPAVRSAPESVDEVGARRRRREAERALHEAEAQHARAERDATKAERDASRAEARVDDLATQITDLESQLATARRDAESAKADAEAAARAHDEATRRREETDAAVRTARDELEQLTRG